MRRTKATARTSTVTKASKKMHRWIAEYREWKKKKEGNPDQGLITPARLVLVIKLQTGVMASSVRVHHKFMLMYRISRMNLSSDFMARDGQYLLSRSCERIRRLRPFSRKIIVPNTLTQFHDFFSGMMRDDDDANDDTWLHSWIASL